MCTSSLLERGEDASNFWIGLQEVARPDDILIAQVGLEPMAHPLKHRREVVVDVRGRIAGEEEGTGNRALKMAEKLVEAAVGDDLLKLWRRSLERSRA